MAWDVRVCTRLADLYLAAASQAAEAVAEQAADSLKYTELSATYEFQPVAVDTHGPLRVSSVSFLSTWAARFLSVLANRSK